MSGTKISAEASGSPAVGTDVFVIARAGANYKLALAQMLAAGDSPITGTTVTAATAFYGSAAANGDVTIEGTSSATKTTSYAILQPTGGFVGIATTTPLVKFHLTQNSDTAYPTLGTTKGAIFISGDTNLFGLYAGVNTSDGNSWLQAMRNDAATAYMIALNPAGGPIGIGGIDTSLSRISAGLMGVGTGAAGSTAGSLSLTNLTASGYINAALLTVGDGATSTELRISGTGAGTSALTGNGGPMISRNNATGAVTIASNAGGVTIAPASAVTTLTGDVTISGTAGFAGAAVSASTGVNTPVGTTALSSLRIPHGAAPTSPVDGDMWSTTTTLNFRLNGVTKSITLL